MKIQCHCGALIVDQTDDLSHKARLLPDQVWNAVSDALDDEVVNAVADGRLGREAACHRWREIVGRSARLMWQCRACGRLYVDDQQHQLQCYVPASEDTSRQVLREGAR